MPREPPPRGHRLAMPFIAVNMGVEMLYILDHRLKAQNVPQDKCRRVISDVSRALFADRFLKELFRPQYAYNMRQVRTVFDKLAHSSIVRINVSSMGKLFDLMTMGIKQQIVTGAVSVRVTRDSRGDIVFANPSEQSEHTSIILCSSHNLDHLLALSLVHLRTLRRMVQLVGGDEVPPATKNGDRSSSATPSKVGGAKDSDEKPKEAKKTSGDDESHVSVRTLIDDTATAFHTAFDTLTLGERQAMWHTVARFLQDRKVKVSFFLADGLQKANGSLKHTTAGPLPEGVSPPGTIKYFQPVSAQAGKVSSPSAASGTKHVSPVEGMYVSSVECLPALENPSVWAVDASSAIMPTEIPIPTGTGIDLPQRTTKTGAPRQTLPPPALVDPATPGTREYVSIPTNIVDSALRLWGSNMYVRDRRNGVPEVGGDEPGVALEQEDLTLRTLGSFLATDDTKEDTDAHTPGLDILDNILSGITSAHAGSDVGVSLFLEEDDEDYTDGKDSEREVVHFPLDKGTSSQGGARLAALAEKLSLDGVDNNNYKNTGGANGDGKEGDDDADSDYDDLLSMMDNM